MGNSVETPTNLTPAVPVAADKDQFGERRGLGVSTITLANAMPPQDPELWRAHGMELLGPPLQVS